MFLDGSLTENPLNGDQQIQERQHEPFFPQRIVLLKVTTVPQAKVCFIYMTRYGSSHHSYIQRIPQPKRHVNLISKVL